MHPPNVQRLKAVTTRLTSSFWIMGLLIAGTSNAEVVPVGGEFQVASLPGFYTFISNPDVELEPSGELLVSYTIDSVRFPPYNELLVFDADDNEGAVSPLPNLPDPTQVARSPDGGFVVVWGDYFSRDQTLRAQRLDTEGTSTGDELVLANLSTRGPWSTFFHRDGRFQVVWYQNPSLWTQQFSPEGAALNTPTALTEQWLEDFAPASHYGLVAVKSVSTDEAGLEILGQRYDSLGMPQGSPFWVNTTTTGDQEAPAVASAPDGSFVVVWEDDDNLSIHGQRFAGNGSRRGPELAIAADPSVAHYGPDVVMTDDGSFFVTWSAYEPGTPDSVWIRQFDACGSPKGDPVLVTTVESPAGLYSPTVAWAAPDKLTVAWVTSTPDVGRINATALWYRRLEVQNPGWAGPYAYVGNLAKGAKAFAVRAQCPSELAKKSLHLEMEP